MKQNYQLMLDQTIKSISKLERKPSLLLHTCCAPCSSYVLEYLSQYFQITLYYYNPNISPQEEYDQRATEQQRLINAMSLGIDLIVATYNPEPFEKMAKGLEHEPEGGARCEPCYKLRLFETGRYAKENNFDYFTTTLSISPHKDSAKLNSIGKNYEEHFQIPYLYSDFKKKGGYQRSCQLSKDFNLYRQDFCGCIYSKENTI